MAFPRSAQVAATSLFTALAVSAHAQAPPLPAPVTNNAVAATTLGSRFTLFSFLGVDSTKRWSGITTSAFRWTSGAPAWERLPDVPGAAGRLAATAQVVRGKVYLFGGYTVSATGAERSVPDVNIFDPSVSRWTAAAPMPTPVDDAVSGAYRDSLVYLISGWHDTDNVSAVQIYDAVANTWAQATPFPGAAVFGHGGSLVGNTILIIDGAKRVPGPTRFAAEPQSWRGHIDETNPRRIVWQQIAQHPGPTRYRAAAAPCGTGAIAVVGGTDNPFNYNGIGYDGRPSEPTPGGLLLDVATDSWRLIPPGEARTMDHRGLAIQHGIGLVIGGMGPGQRVSNAVSSYLLPQC